MTIRLRDDKWHERALSQLRYLASGGEGTLTSIARGLDTSSEHLRRLAQDAGIVFPPRVPKAPRFCKKCGKPLGKASPDHTIHCRDCARKQARILGPVPVPKRRAVVAKGGAHG